MDTNNLSLSRCYDQPSARTSALDFLLALQMFLGQNQIEYVGPFRMRIEPTPNNNWALLVEGEANISSSDTPDQVSSGFPWPPTPPEYAPAHEIEMARPESNMTPSDVSFFTRHMGMQSDYLGNIHAPSRINISPDLLFIGVGETDTLSPRFFDCMDPTVVDARIPPTTRHNPPAASHNPSHSPRHPVNSELQITTASFAAGGQNSPASIQTEHKAHVKRNRLQRQRVRLNPSDTETELILKYLSQNMLCEDFYSFLDSKVPCWIRRGIWNEHENEVQNPAGPDPASSVSPYFKLEQAYRTVCQVSSRIGDDLVRDRVGLIRLHLEFMETHRVRRHRSSSKRTTSTVGRGDATHVIDRILENIHEGWTTLSQARRAELRAKFHERKKYGKRWSQLANALGPGLLLICSTKLASAIRSTTVTANMLDSLIDRFKLTNLDSMKVINIVNPLAACLLQNEGYRDLDASTILHQLQTAVPQAPLKKNSAETV